jgi:hypothetical protein
MSLLYTNKPIFHMKPKGDLLVAIGTVGTFVTIGTFVAVGTFVAIV